MTARDDLEELIVQAVPFGGAEHVQFHRAIDAYGAEEAARGAAEERESARLDCDNCMADYGRGFDDCQAAVRARVEAVHEPHSREFLVAGHDNGDTCGCLDECPLEMRQVCGHCDELIDAIDEYASETRGYLALWPCPTIAALAADGDQATEGDRG